MCLNMWYYPLVIDNIGVKKILFKYGIKITDRRTFEEVSDLSNEIKKGKLGVSKFDSLNHMFKKEKISEFLKMVSVPCGSCSECISSYSREWSYRIYLESRLYDSNECWFVTLTYNDENLPSNHMLEKDAISRFNKKLKTYLTRSGKKSNFRFYGVGEYGSKSARPHYHVIYFGLPLDDLKLYNVTSNGDLLFTSSFLENVWGKGFVTIGSVSVSSACYVARYCDKKRRLSKQEKDALINRGVVPEFSVMSRMPGIGSYFLEDIKKDFSQGLYTHFVNGSSFSIPVAWRKSIKKDFENMPSLNLYEENASLKSSVKINSLLSISDRTDLTSYLSEKNVISTKRSL